MEQIAKMNMGILLGVVVIVVVVAAAGALVLTQPSTPTTTTSTTSTTTHTTTTTSSSTTTTAMRDIVFQLDFLPAGSHISLYAAKERFWPQLGLNVEIIRGEGSGDTAQKVGEGLVDFGRASFDQGVKVICEVGSDIVAIDCSVLKCDTGILWVKDRDAGRGAIDKNDLTTLTGKLYGGQVWTPTFAMLPAFLETVGLAPDAMERVEIDPGAQIAALIRGDFDAVGPGMGEDATYNATLETEGMTGDVLWFQDYGFVVMGDAHWTSRRMIEEEPETVAKFVQGLQEAFIWSLAHPDEAAADMAKNIPAWLGQEDVAVAEFIARYQNTMDMQVAEEHGVGYMPAETVNTSLANIYAMYSVASGDQPDASSIYTNEFIDPSIVPTSYPW